MKIVYVIPGFGGGFYCENCVRDNDLLQKLTIKGHQIKIASMYLPLADQTTQQFKDHSLFYGVINVYLKENIPFLRKMPQWMEDFFNRSFFLKIAASMSGTANARGLEKMTVSVLKGEQGNQAKELQELIKWLKEEIKPDLVHISNLLLIGLAKPIKNELNIPVVCTMQDEDIWIDQMDPVYQKQIWQIITDKSQFVDRFIPVSHYYKDAMQARLGISDNKFHVIYNGINLEEFQHSPLPMDPPVIGFVSKMSTDFGTDILMKAFKIIKKEKEFANLKLRLTGGLIGNDRKVLKKIIAGLRDKKLINDIEVLPDEYQDHLPEFLSGLTLLSVPMKQGEAFGTYLVKAQASGVPVIQPDVGGYGELIHHSKGGLLYSPNTPTKLAKKIMEALGNQKLLKTMAKQGREYTFNHFDINQMVHEMVEIYDQLVESAGTEGG